MREAVAGLARSRHALIEHIRQESQPPRRGEPAGSFARLRAAAGTWWRYHPAHLVVELATPLLSKYTARSPWWFLAGAAASGALFAKARAWRLLSLSRLLALASSSQLPTLMLSALSARGSGRESRKARLAQDAQLFDPLALAADGPP